MPRRKSSTWTVRITPAVKEALSAATDGDQSGNEAVTETRKDIESGKKAAAPRVTGAILEAQRTAWQEGRIGCIPARRPANAAVKDRR